MDITRLASTILQNHIQTIATLPKRLDATFTQLCQDLAALDRPLILMGIGKSGHIARKVAATFSSTGTPAFFVHPAEACHGDMGAIRPDDWVMAFSQSGETPEIIQLIPALRTLKARLILLTGQLDSRLANMADFVIDVSIQREACPLGLAPTTSTVVAMIIGDTMALVVSALKGFTTESFARSHPGGKLGKELCLTVADLMLKGSDIPICHSQQSLNDALIEMSAKRLGATLITCHKSRALLGIFTDGDLRRTLEQQTHLTDVPLKHLMTTSCISITANEKAKTALAKMRQHAINVLAVINDQHQPIGILHLHHLIQEGLS